MTASSIKPFIDSDWQFICVNCRTSCNGNFDFQKSLARLEKSIINGRGPTTAKQESHLFGKRLGLLERETSIARNRDKVAEAILKHCGKGNSNVNAVSVTGDGNCLYNCLSIAVCGNEERSMEIRWQCAIELLLQKEYYKTYHATHSLDAVSPTYKEACLDATKNHAYSSPGTSMQRHPFCSNRFNQYIQL